MKKYIALFIGFGLPILMFSQIKKGSWMIGGRIDGTYIHEINEFVPNAVIRSSYNFNPVFAYFVLKRLSVGGEYNFNHVKGKEIGDGVGSDLSLTDHSIRPFARFFITQRKFRPFLITEAEYIATSLERTSGFLLSEKAKYFRWMWGFGFNWLWSKNIALNASATFLIEDFGTKSELRETQDDNFFVRFGMQFYLNDNQKPTIPLFDNFYNRENFFWQLSGGGSQEFSEFNFRFLLSGGFRQFVSSKFEWGMNLGVNVNAILNIEEDESFEAKMHFGFYQPLTKNLRLFEKAELGYFHSASYFNFFDSVSRNLFRTSVKPGILYFLGKQNVLTANLNCSYLTGEESEFLVSFVNERNGMLKLFSLGWEAGIEHFVQENMSMSFIGNWNLINEKFEDDNGVEPPNRLNYVQSSNIKIGINYYFFSKKRKPPEGY